MPAELSSDLVQLSAFDVVDKTTDVVLVRHERARLDSRDRLTDILFGIGKRFQCERVTMPQSVW
jgi:hypothetical protein